MHALMRSFAYLYFAGVSAFLAGIALVAYLSGFHTLNSGGMTPQTGEDLSRLLLGIGVIGLITIALAVLGKMRWLFSIYAIFITIMMFRWLFLSSYTFESPDAFWMGVLLFGGAVIATLFSLFTLRSGRPRRR